MCAGSESNALASSHCVRCGYDLRGLSDNSNCPECGIPVSDSGKDLLRHADPAWLAVLLRGMDIARCGRMLFFILVIVFLATAVIGVSLHSLFVGTVIETVMNVLIWSIGVLIVVAFIMIGIGLWLISTPEPREHDDARAAAAYRILSCALVPALGFWYYLAGAQPLVAIHWILQQVAVHVCFAAAIAHAVLMSLHAAQLERRVPAAKDPAPRALLKVRPIALSISVTLVLGAYWLLPTALSLRPGWHPPGDTAQMMLFLLTVLVWFALLSHLLQLRPAIAQDRELS